MQQSHWPQNSQLIETENVYSYTITTIQTFKLIDYFLSKFNQNKKKKENPIILIA